MNSIERVSEYIGMPLESDGGAYPPAAWPTTGDIEVSDLVHSFSPLLLFLFYYHN